MQPTTIDDRKAELRALLEKMDKNPEHDWSEARQRVAVLNRMIAGETEAAD